MSSLYLHIPFCEHKCQYCDFYSIVDRSLQGDVVAAMRAEIARTPSEYREEEVDSVFFGGGTPSLLRPEEIEMLLGGIARLFRLTSNAEITLEANPGTLDPEALKMLRSLGVNRLSLGVQSFADEELRWLGRIHNAGESRDAFLWARAAGFENLSIDLIYSLPGQELARWTASLEEAVRLGPEHISAYSLIVEEGTPLHLLVEQGVVASNGADHEALLYAHTMDFLRGRGYEQYEVSNYARAGFASRHNGAYWRHENYLGWGPSAHSFWKEPGGRTARRWWNTPDVGDYVRSLAAGAPAPFAEERVGEREMINERIFLGLRSDGVDLRRLREQFAIDLLSRSGDAVEGLRARGLATIDGERLRLTRAGYLLCDEIAARLMVA